MSGAAGNTAVGTAKRKRKMLARRLGTTLRRKCVFFPLSVPSLPDPDFRSQPLLIHTLPKSAPANSFESHSSKKSRINVKTKPFNPSRLRTCDTPPCNSFRFTHFLKQGGRGRGVPSALSSSCRSFAPRVSNAMFGDSSSSSSCISSSFHGGIRPSHAALGTNHGPRATDYLSQFTRPILVNFLLALHSSQRVDLTYC